MSTLVSIIIPCHNAEKYIAECIDSALNQSHPDIEIICVENNSVDNTWGVLNELANKYPEKVTVLTQIAKGASVARNSGLSIAKGEWIQFLDADDILLPDKISNQLKLIGGKSIDLVIGNYSRTENEVTENIKQITNTWEGLIKGRLGFTSSNLWRKSVLIKIGGWDDIKSSQEAYLMFKILQQNGITLFDEEFYTIKIERTTNSISKTNVKDNIIRYIELRIAIWEYLKTSGQLTDDILKVLKINVFDSIRILYKENKLAGTDLYNKYVKDKFKPIPSSATSVLYLCIYTIAGFKLVQKVTG